VYQRSTSANSKVEERGTALDETWDYSQSDTEMVAELVRRALNDCENLDERDQEAQSDTVLERLASAMGSLVNAEFAFCVVRMPVVYYGRDGWGRRSLVCGRRRNEDDAFRLASVAFIEDEDAYDWIEVPPGRVYGYNLQTNELQEKLYVMPADRELVTNGSLSSKRVDESSSCEAASHHFEMLLLEAVRRRIHCSTSSGISILFSGGVDSVVLAAMALRILDESTPLYLVNVEFLEDHDEAHSTDNPAADTVSARASYEDLSRRYPNHAVRYITEQVTWRDIQAQQPRIRTLVYPKSSVMDLNIGAALWFAAKASPTRVVLTGLGADEQLGGYGRHRKAWDRGCASGGNDAPQMLRQELQLDQERLWERNLGRDDRILSDHGKEARLPFLDSAVVAYLRSLPVQLICDYSLPPGLGDKRILRLMAARLGCPSAAVAVKRAIQFGSRMAHVCDKKRFGSRRKASGEASVPAPP
jgi:asparagine synthetase B (glutamine-hydrolysing)